MIDYQVSGPLLRGTFYFISSLLSVVEELELYHSVLKTQLLSLLITEVYRWNIRQQIIVIVKHIRRNAPACLCTFMSSSTDNGEGFCLHWKSIETTKKVRVKMRIMQRRETRVLLERVSTKAINK